MDGPFFLFPHADQPVAVRNREQITGMGAARGEKHQVALSGAATTMGGGHELLHC